jgi:hypothetical protein
MSVNDTSRIITYVSRVMLQIVGSLIDDSEGAIYDFNMFIVQAIDHNTHSLTHNFNYSSPKLFYLFSISPKL